jgi:uncharacterized protein
VGSLLGGKLAGRIHEDVLRKAFGWFVLGMGAFVLAQQLPARLWISPQLWPVISVLAAVTIGAGLVVRRHRHRTGENQPRPDGERVSGSHGR